MFHPNNWKKLRVGMDERHAALIVGQSGTGKTMATKKLYEELRQTIPGLERVSITRGPAQLSGDRTKPPVLYDIEDPWGRLDFVPDSRPWNDQLPLFFANASHDRLFVATSRLDVAHSSKALEGVKRWIIPLEAEHYGEAERQELYRSRIALLPRDLRLSAAESEQSVLSELGTPLEIQKFFDALVTLDRESLATTSALISEAINIAHHNSIERTVVDQIDQRNDVRAAAVLWGLLKLTDRLSLAAVRTIEEKLADRDAALMGGVSPLIHFFVAARNLRQTADIVAYYHPRVEAGIEQSLVSDRLVVRSVLARLVDVLTLSTELGEAWGAAMAARLLSAARKELDLDPKIKRDSLVTIDSWIAGQLAKGGSDLRANLVLAAEAGSTESSVSEVARYLLNRRDRDFPGIFEWAPPDRDESWYARLRRDPATRPLVSAFIQGVLPTEHAGYRQSFAIDLERLVPNLSKPFIDAALGVVQNGYFLTLDAVLEGALSDLDGFEEVVDAAVETLSQFDEDRPDVAREHLAIVNREYSEDYAQMLIEHDGGAASYEFLEGYTKRIRATRGWQYLLQHRHFNRLCEHWLNELANEEKPDLEEVKGVFLGSYRNQHETLLWFVVSKAWHRSYQEALTTRVAEGHENGEVRQAALHCLLQHAPTELAAICRTRVARGDSVGLVEMAIDLGHLRNGRTVHGERQDAVGSTELALLPGIALQITDAYLALEGGSKPTISEEVRGVLEAAPGWRRGRASIPSFGRRYGAVGN